MQKNIKTRTDRVRRSVDSNRLLFPLPQGTNRMISTSWSIFCNAFTIIEIIVVVIIIAIAAAVIIPYAIGTTASQARSAARMVMSDLSYAQNEAIVTQTPITVAFDISTNSYTVSNESGPLIHPITKKAYMIDLDTISGFGDVTISSVNFGGSATVTFDAIGAPSNGGTIVVSAGQHSYSITVAPVTGKITVSQCQ